MQTPVLHSMILCDYALQEQGSGKYSLIGAFTHIYSSQFPAIHPACCLYLCLTDGEGAYEFKVELRYLAEEERTVFTSDGVILRMQDRLMVTEASLTFRRLSFETPGKYEIILTANGVEIGRKPLWVTKLVQEGNQVK